MEQVSERVSDDLRMTHGDITVRDKIRDPYVVLTKLQIHSIT